MMSARKKKARKIGAGRRSTAVNYPLGAVASLLRPAIEDQFGTQNAAAEKLGYVTQTRLNRLCNQETITDVAGLSNRRNSESDRRLYADLGIDLRTARTAEAADELDAFLAKFRISEDVARKLLAEIEKAREDRESELDELLDAV